MCDSTTSLTLFPADDNDGAQQLQAAIAIGVEGPSGALDPRSCLEVDGVQSNGLGVGEEGVGVHLPHGAGHTIGAGGGADEPAVLRECVVDVLHGADGTRFVEVVVFGVTGLRDKLARVIKRYPKCLCVCGSEKTHTYRHTHDWVPIGWVGLIFGFSCVIVH